MTANLDVNISFGPRAAWPLLAALYLAFPGLAATGDAIDARNYQPSPAGVYQTLVVTGPTDLSLDGDAAAGQVKIGPSAGGPLWTGKLLVGLPRTQASSPCTTGAPSTNGNNPCPNPISTPAPSMIVNGNLQVTGCIYLDSGGVVTKRCNWCRPGYTCDPGLW